MRHARRGFLGGGGNAHVRPLGGGVRRAGKHDARGIGAGQRICAGGRLRKQQRSECQQQSRSNSGCMPAGAGTLPKIIRCHRMYPMQF